MAPSPSARQRRRKATGRHQRRSRSWTAGSSLQTGSGCEVVLIGSREFRAAGLVNRIAEPEAEFSALGGALVVFGLVIPGRTIQICITGAPRRNRTCCLAVRRPVCPLASSTCLDLLRCIRRTRCESMS